MSTIKHKDGRIEDISLKNAEIQESGILIQPEHSSDRRFIPHSSIEEVTFGSGVKVTRTGSKP